jgi:hypothetical protein
MLVPSGFVAPLCGKAPPFRLTARNKKPYPCHSGKAEPFRTAGRQSRSAAEPTSALFTLACVNARLGLGRKFFSADKPVSQVNCFFTITCDQPKVALVAPAKYRAPSAKLGHFSTIFWTSGLIFDRFRLFSCHFRSPIRRLHRFWNLLRN